MSPKAVIETGVDKLVRLVARKKKISVKEAAKEIGVTNSNIEEWADFLEEEGIISIENTLTKTYLVEKKLSKSEVKTKSKEYEKEQKIFSRKVQMSIEELESDTKAIEHMKNEFEKLRGDIGGDLKNIEDDFSDIEKFRELEEEVKQKEGKFEKEYSTKLAEVQKQLESKEKSLSKILLKAHNQSNKVKTDIHKLQKLEGVEKTINKKIVAFESFIDKVSKDMHEESEILDEDKGSLQNLDTEAEKLKDEIQSDTNKLARLREDLEKKQKKIEGMEDSFMSKLKGSGIFTKKRQDEGNTMSKKLKTFFTKSKEVETIMGNLEQDTKNIENEFGVLSKRAVAFDAAKSNTSKEYLSSLEKELHQINKKKEDLKKKFSKLRLALKRF